jgi:F-type H+-transporting ATPase subunit h
MARLIRIEIVQDLFISELRSYKPVLQSTEVDKGAVKELKLPAQPAVPAVSSNIDAELAAYDVTEQVEESAVEEDEYEEAVVRH